jgi:hypothetical protein
MKVKYLLCASLFLLPFSSQSETQWSLGTGYQYGSLIGFQYSYIYGSNKFYASAGLVGAALGYDTALDSQMKHTLGFAAGSEQLTSEDGFAVLVYNYHFDGMHKAGWKLGVSAGLRRQDSASFFGSAGDSVSQTALSIELGYKF